MQKRSGRGYALGLAQTSIEPCVVGSGIQRARLLLALGFKLKAA